MKVLITLHAFLFPFQVSPLSCHRCGRSCKRWVIEEKWFFDVFFEVFLLVLLSLLFLGGRSRESLLATDSYMQSNSVPVFME